MPKINEVEFVDSMGDILAELQNQLIANDIPYLHTIRYSSGNYMVPCPYHKNGLERKPSAGIKETDGTFHCFRAGTQVLTNIGSKPIEDLVNKNVCVINGDGEWENTTFRNYGKSPLMKVTLSQDRQIKTIFATPEHEWFIHRGTKDVVTTQELKSGMALVSCIMPDVKWVFNLEGFIHGVVYGDGCRRVSYKRTKHIGVITLHKDTPIGVTYRVNIPKFTKKCGLVKYFEDAGWRVSDYDCMPNYTTVESELLPLEHDYKKVPIECSYEYAISFLSGYFATDGSVDLNNISCADFDKLNEVRNLCIKCGIAVRDIRRVERTNTYIEGVSVLYILPILRKSLPREFYVLDDVHDRKYCRSRWKVVSVECTDLVEDVYCCETSTHSFVLDGNILTHNCFACGETHTLPEVISFVFGHNDMTGGYGWSWLLKNFLSIEVEKRPDIQLDFSRGKKKDTEKKIEYVSEEELDSYRYTHPYWEKRGIVDDDIIELFDLGYDKKTKCITFPVRDIKGNCLFVARRNVKTKFFNYPKGVTKPLYGLYELYSDIRDRPLDLPECLVCESMIDCILLWQAGYYAVALNGLGNNLQMKQLAELPCRELVLATDNDEAGDGARDRIKSMVKGKIFSEIIFPRGIKDIGECSAEQVKNIIKWKEYI